jgi:hypothetical protein
MNARDPTWSTSQFRGADTGPVTPDAPGVTGTTIISAGGPNLADGNRSPAVTCFVWPG